MKIRVEISSLATPHQSGVATYAKLLTEALGDTKGTDIYGHYFNFLKRQPKPDIKSSVKLESNPLVPLRVFAKAHSHGVSVPFDVRLPKVDLTIFPNFATWPVGKSKLTATTVHDLTYLYHPEYTEAKNLLHLRRVVPRSLESADFILTVSNAVKAEIVKEFKIDEEKVVVTQIPPDDVFKKKLTKEMLDKVRAKYGIGAQKYILFLGNFEPRKNLKSLVEAYRKLPDATKKEYALVLAGGKGWNSEETQKAVNDAVSAGANVKHIGYIDREDRPALYQAASLFVFPSVYEGFGIPVLEAMASGCPVVAADIPVLHEAGGDAALYADTSNIAALSRTIHHAIEKYPYTTSQMQQNIDRFNWDDNVQKIVDKATTLLDNRA